MSILAYILEFANTSNSIRPPFDNYPLAFMEENFHFWKLITRRGLHRLFLCNNFSPDMANSYVTKLQSINKTRVNFEVLHGLPGNISRGLATHPFD